MKVLIEAAFPYRDSSHALREADAIMSNSYALAEPNKEEVNPFTGATTAGFPMTKSIGAAIGEKIDASQADQLLRAYFLSGGEPLTPLTPKQVMYLHENLSTHTGVFLSRAMIWIYETRPDLQAAFSLGTNDYAAWFFYHGLAEFPKFRQLPEELIAALCYLSVGKDGEIALRDTIGLRYLLVARPDIRQLLEADHSGKQLKHWLLHHGLTEHHIISIVHAFSRHLIY